MKTFHLIILTSISILSFTQDLKAEWVRGYMRGGSYVPGYFRTERDNNPYDNLNSFQSPPTNYQNYQMNHYPSMLMPSPFQRRQPVGIIDPLPSPEGMDE